MNSPDLLQLFLAAIFIGTLTAYLAKGRGRDPTKWFFVGMMGGIFGLIALYLFPIIEPEASKTDKPVPQIVPPEPVVDELAIANWYYLDAEHNTLGPVPLDMLKQLFRDGSMTLRSYVWCKGMEGWNRIEALPELKSRFDKLLST